MKNTYITVFSGVCSDIVEYEGFSLYDANEAFNTAVENMLSNNHQSDYRYHVSISFEIIAITDDKKLEFIEFYPFYKIYDDDYISISGYNKLKTISENKMYLCEQYFNFITKYIAYKK